MKSKIPGDLQDLAEEWRTKLVEAVSWNWRRTHDGLLWKVKNDGPALKAATVPTVAADFTQYSVFVFKNKVQLMLDGVIDYSFHLH